MTEILDTSVAGQVPRDLACDSKNLTARSTQEERDAEDLALAEDARLCSLQDEIDTEHQLCSTIFCHVPPLCAPLFR